MNRVVALVLAAGLLGVVADSGCSAAHAPRTDAVTKVTARDALAGACARVAGSRLSPLSEDQIAECERAVRDAVAAARRAGGNPRIELLDGCEAASQLGQTCSATDPPVLVVNH